MSAQELLDGTVNKVEVRKEGTTHHVYVNGERMERLTGYKIQSHVDTARFAYVTLEFLSNDVTVEADEGKVNDEPPRKGPEIHTRGG